MIDMQSEGRGHMMCVVVMVTGGILGRWGGRMQRDSCWAMATRGELSLYVRVRPQRVNIGHTRV